MDYSHVELSSMVVMGAFNNQLATEPLLQRRIEEKLRAAQAQAVPKSPADIGAKALDRAKRHDAVADTLRAAAAPLLAAQVARKALERARQMDAKSDMLRAAAISRELRTTSTIQGEI